MKKIYFLIAFTFFTDTSFGVSRFDPILREVIKFQEFENDLEESDKKKNDFDKESLLGNYLENDNFNNINDLINNYTKLFIDTSIINHQSEERKEYIEDLYKRSIQLTSNEISVSNFLEYLLKKRLKIYIYHYAHYLEKKEQYKNLPPLEDNLFMRWEKEFCSDDEIYLERDENKTERITRYQFIVSLIKKTFQIVNIDELSTKAIKLLRASPALWPILQNKTLTLGHSDESGGYIRIKAYMDQFKVNIKRAIRKINAKADCSKWNKIKELTDLYLYETHILEHKHNVQFKGLGAPEEESTIKLTDYQNGKFKPLPYPDFLKVQQEQPFVEFESFFDTFNFNELSDESEFITSFAHNEETVNDNRLLSIYDISTKKVNFFVNNNNIIKYNDYIYPAGIRKFHNLMPESNYDTLNLNAKDQDFVDRIFNLKTYKKVSYKDFENFWYKMGGVIIENGGSHKLLIGPKSDSLYGIFAHNGAHTYGPKTIKYFRAALYYIGCRPN